ncbi:MAG: D-aminoacyl-tRNA deacylase [Gammaproteobacteria bacterium]|jgi:D-tyrosyl-tRNA(Tyr) deacylase
MIALLQRVIHASVKVESKIVGTIDSGLLVFIGVEREDQEKNADRLLERVLGYRIFGDADDKMNLSVQDVKGGLLLVPQFTLAADTKKGMRPSFTSAAPPEQGHKLFRYLLNQAKQRHHFVAAGQFGAHMQVDLCNDGPVTFLLRG